MIYHGYVLNMILPPCFFPLFFGFGDEKEKLQQIALFPTNLFTNLERIDEFYVVQERRATDFKAPKLGKGSLGSLFLNDGL